jgi:hypothetical protein
LKLAGQVKEAGGPSVGPSLSFAGDRELGVTTTVGFGFLMAPANALPTHQEPGALAGCGLISTGVVGGSGCWKYAKGIASRMIVTAIMVMIFLFNFYRLTIRWFSGFEVGFGWE